MSIESEHQPSMRVEMEAGLKKLKDKMEKTYDPNDVLDETKTLDDLVYFNFFSHFPNKLAQRLTEGFRNLLGKKFNLPPEKAGNKFREDLRAAIQEADVNKSELQTYLDRISEGEVPFATASVELYEALLVPVYIKLREKGYTHNELK